MTTIAAYNFDNVLEGAVVYDATGNHNGAVVGTVPLVDGPISSKSRYFPGTLSDRIDIPDHVDFRAVNDRTYEVWATPSSISDSMRFLVKKEASLVQIPVLLDFFSGGGAVRFYVRDSSSNYCSAQSSGLSFVAGNLIYIVGVWYATPKTAILYVNGVPCATSTNASLVPADCTNIEPLHIGGDIYQWWKGTIHSVRVSNTAKTSKAIYDTYMAANVQET